MKRRESDKMRPNYNFSAGIRGKHVRRLVKLRNMKAADVKLTAEHPELDVKRIARIIVRKGLKPVGPVVANRRRRARGV
jgi:hypothetical protein